MSDIIGTIPICHSVDVNGSFTIEVPIQLPPANVTPDVSLAYHSAAEDSDVVGPGWTLKAAAVIERVPATKAQDDFRGEFGVVISWR